MFSSRFLEVDSRGPNPSWLLPGCGILYELLEFSAYVTAGPPSQQYHEGSVDEELAERLAHSKYFAGASGTQGICPIPRGSAFLGFWDHVSVTDTLVQW